VAHPKSIPHIEVRSIDYVPPAERHGRIKDQFTLWFALNANIFNVVLGGIVISMGVGFVWACVAIVAGTLIGLFFVGFHAIQGPRLGLPQLIQSRGQFGFYGAFVVFAASIILDVGFLAAQLVIQADAAHLLVGSISLAAWIAILAVPVAVITVYGYDWIHAFQRWMTGLLGVAFVIVLVRALDHRSLTGDAAQTVAPGFAVLLAATGLFVIAMVSWGPYVSDYSRYLPATLSMGRLFWAVVLGCAIPTIFCGVLGAYIVGLSPHASSTVDAVRSLAGRWVLPVLAASLVGSDVANAYSGMLALAGVVSCVRDVRDSVAMRVVGSLVMVGAGTVCALLAYKQFVTNLTNFLDVLLYVFIPWTAVNLSDYYLIRRGSYDIPSFFTPKGIYGGVLWRGLLAYLLAVAAEIPFIDETYVTGPLVKPLGGSDISWVVGATAGFAFYLIACQIPDYRRGRASQSSRSSL
jgi:nucleobase:cation symporter-1, NCS1 family